MKETPERPTATETDELVMYFSFSYFSFLFSESAKHRPATKPKGKSSRHVFGLRAAFRRAPFLARWTAEAVIGPGRQPGAPAGPCQERRPPYNVPLAFACGCSNQTVSEGTLVSVQGSEFGVQGQKDNNSEALKSEWSAERNGAGAEMEWSRGAGVLTAERMHRGIERSIFSGFRVLGSRFRVSDFGIFQPRMNTNSHECD